MTATIAYDKKVTNYIDALTKTGHVTRRSYKKKSVTLHHNGGRLSHAGVLNVWKTRPASAHFDVDSKGAVAQYVSVNHYAWAVGNTKGNQESISIEMANSALAPSWTVSETTWKSAARLAGWLFWKVIGARPSKSNFFYHHHWSATACAGPYMDKVYDKVLKAAQDAYDSFKKPSTPTKPKPESKEIVPKSRESAATVLEQKSDALRAWPFIPAVEKKYGLPVDLLFAVGSRETNLGNKVGDGGHGHGVWQQDDRWWPNMPSDFDKNVQKQAEKAADMLADNYAELKSWPNAIAAYNAGKTGVKDALKAGHTADYATTGKDYAADVLGRQAHMKKTAPKPKPKPKPPARPKKSVKQMASEVIAGKWGNGDDRIKRLRAAGYDPVAIQAEINHKLGAKPNRKKSNAAIAQEVIQGKWGNGDTRIKKLRAAGYNPTAIQAEVNRRL